MRTYFTYLVLLWSLTVAGQSAEPRPNVLFIAVDDLNDWIGALGGYGGRVHTPNLDRLARRGTVFTNAHAQAPLCGPSRASLMSGLRPSTTGVYGMIDDDSLRGASPALEDVVFLPDYFGTHGYRTLGIGKLFHQHAPEGTFDVSGGRAPGFGPFPPDRFHWTGEAGEPGYGRTSTDWGAYPSADSLMPDHRAASWAIEQLSQTQAAPFFLAVGFLRPHVPWYVPPAWFAEYAQDSVVTPPYFAADTNDLPPIAHRINDLPMMPSTEWAQRSGQWPAIIRAYLACVTFVDYQVGRVLDALDQSPYAANTVIVLWSDHGYRLGEKGTFAKHALWEPATRVPLVFAGPGIDTGRIDRPVELLDVYPTLASLCGLPPPEHAEGTSLVPGPEGRMMNADTVALTTYGYGNHAVRSPRYRYIRYEDGGEELYDMRYDPEEFANLASSEAFRPVIERLRTHLPDRNAPWAPASSYDYQPYFREQKARYGSGQ